MRVRTALAAVILAAAAGACATAPAIDGDWDLHVEASVRADGRLDVRTFMSAPADCFTRGEIRAVPSAFAETIRIEATVLRTERPCGEGRQELVHDLVGVAVGPGQRLLEAAALADGETRDRVVVEISRAAPVGTRRRP